MKFLSIQLVLCTALVFACGRPASEAPGLASGLASVLKDAKLVDLSYAYDADTLYWPTNHAFVLERVAYGPNQDGDWYASNDFSTSEHGGTHIDAPIHFAEGGNTTAQIPLTQLVGPACVIDIREACSRDRDYLLTVTDIEAHERECGEIPRGAVVLVRTGWGRFWPDRQAYLGDATAGDVSNLHFPGLGPEAAALLVERGVDMVGIDTASIDHGPSRDFLAHRILARANVPGLENVASLAELPPRGAQVIALPVKITHGTGGPCRIVAVLP